MRIESIIKNWKVQLIGVIIYLGVLLLVQGRIITKFLLFWGISAIIVVIHDIYQKSKENNVYLSELFDSLLVGAIKGGIGLFILIYEHQGKMIILKKRNLDSNTTLRL